MKRLAVLSLTALALTCSSVWQANAENYMYLFDGTVTSSTYTGIDPGNPLTGWFAYANDIPLDSEVPGRARYLTESAGELGAFVTIGDTTFDSSNAHGVEISLRCRKSVLVK